MVRTCICAHFINIVALRVYIASYVYMLCIPVTIVSRSNCNAMYTLLPLLTLLMFMTSTVFYYQQQQSIAYVQDSHIASTPVEEPLILPSIKRPESVGKSAALVRNTTSEDTLHKGRGIFLASVRANATPMEPLTFSPMNPLPDTVYTPVRAKFNTVLACMHEAWSQWIPYVCLLIEMQLGESNNYRIYV